MANRGDHRESSVKNQMSYDVKFFYFLFFYKIRPQRLQSLIMISFLLLIKPLILLLLLDASEWFILRSTNSFLRSLPWFKPNERGTINKNPRKILHVLFVKLVHM